MKFEGDIREFFVDIALMDNHFLRLGRQLVVWGEMDGFRVMDQVNPLDVSFTQFFFMPEESTIPLWMVRYDYTPPDIGQFSNIELELLWTMDLRPMQLAAAGAPYSVPFSALVPVPDFLKITTVEVIPERRIENSEIGARMSFMLGRWNMSISDYYGIQDSGAYSLSGFDLSYLIKPGPELIGVELESDHPFINFLGFSFNYYDEFTKGVFRGEAIYTWNFRPLIDLTTPEGLENGHHKVDRIDWGVGFDRQTWIRFLNSSSTFMLSLQQLGRHYRGSLNAYLDPNEMDEAGRELLARFGITERIQLVRENSYLTTFLIQTFYSHGNLVPLVLLAYDWDGILITSAECKYQYNTHLSFKVHTVFALGDPVGDAERDPLLKQSEVAFKITWQL
ncbi:MAG: hypothetical protein JRJ85_11540 [Deltaproteobacteria bacterium]|nr:hypothetical protein [Deltaproteobacteria bacterium]